MVRTTCLHKQVECAWIAFRRGNDRLFRPGTGTVAFLVWQQNGSYGLHQWRDQVGVVYLAEMSGLPCE